MYGARGEFIIAIFRNFSQFRNFPQFAAIFRNFPQFPQFFRTFFQKFGLQFFLWQSKVSPYLGSNLKFCQIFSAPAALGIVLRALVIIPAQNRSIWTHSWAFLCTSDSFWCNLADVNVHLGLRKISKISPGKTPVEIFLSPFGQNITNQNRNFSAIFRNFPQFSAIFRNFSAIFRSFSKNSGCIFFSSAIKSINLSG